MLDDKTHKKITGITNKGNELFAKEEYKKAFNTYLQALKLIPEPIEDYEAATWVLAALGDCMYMMGDYEKAHEYFAHAVYSHEGLGNPFIHLRLGETQFENGNIDRAKDELARAYMGAGLEIFENEDPKYLKFLRLYMKEI